MLIIIIYSNTLNQSVMHSSPKCLKKQTSKKKLQVICSFSKVLNK